MDRTHYSLKHWSLFSSSLFNSPPVKFYTPSPFVSDPFSHARKLEYELLISSDEFRMFEFKIRKCTRSRSHDWTDCPYAHHGEKARRRDPRIYPYSGISCPDFRRGKCMRGVHCEFAHGIFEFWLHPFKYRTLMCQEGNVCRRKVCFFAHSPEQLRSPPENSGRQCNCCLYRRAAPVDPMDPFYLVSWLKRLEMEEGCGAKVSGGYGEDTLFSEADYRWVSELVRDE